MIAGARMVEREVDELPACAGSACFGEQDHPAQLANFAAIDQCRAAYCLFVQFRKPDATATGFIELRLGNGFRNKFAKGFTEAVAFNGIAQPVQVDDQLVIARSPVMSKLDWFCPHAAWLRGKIFG